MKKIIFLFVLLIIAFTGFSFSKTKNPYLVTDLNSAGNAADYVIVSPDAFLSTLIPLARHREKQGRRVAILRLEDIGRRELMAKDVRDVIRNAYKNWKEPKPAFLLLVGDAVSEKGGGNVVPTFSVTSLLSESVKIASDYPYGLMDNDDEVAEIAVGRLPADNTSELKIMVDKILQYETNRAPSSWRKRFTLIAGSGKFGGLIDSVLEDLAMATIGIIPPEYDVTATYANEDSPYCYLPEKFNEQVIKRFNESSLLFVYVGHGARASFDTLLWKKKDYPVLNRKSLKKMKAHDGLPVMVVVACSTAEFDHPKEDSIGEQLLKLKSGPVAFIGGSRVTAPIGNGVFLKEFLEAFVDSTTKRTLGQMLDHAKSELERDKKDKVRQKFNAAASLFMDKKTRKKDRRDHMYYYNLLGDPALTVRFIEEKLSLDVELKENKIFVKGKVPFEEGKGEVSLEVDRKIIYYPLYKLIPEDADWEKKVEANYKAANNKVLNQKTVTLTSSQFETELSLPEEVRPGNYVVKAYVSSPEIDSFGAAAFLLQKEPDGSLTFHLPSQ